MARFNSTVQRAPIVATAAGDTAVVAAQGAGKKIGVIRVMVITKTALDIKFRSGTTDLTGTMGLAAGNGFRDALTRNADDSGDSLFETNANEALNINLSAIGTVGGYIAYVVR